MATSQKWMGRVAYAAFLFAFVEIALQAFYYATAGDFLFRRISIPMWAPDPYAGIFNRPNLALEHRTGEFAAWYYTNAQGLRVPASGRDFARPKGADTYRVMLLGPSFTFGWGVDYEETFAAKLERELDARGFAGNRKIELINAGVPSLFPASELKWYDQEGRTYQPDLVIQFIYGSMAVSNDTAPTVVVDDEGYLEPIGEPAGSRYRAYAKKLATVFYGWMIWTKFEAWRAPPAGDARRPVLGAGRKLEAAVTFDPSSELVRDALAFYRDLERIVHREGTELVILYLPLSYAIHPEDLVRWRHLGVQNVAAQIAFNAEFESYLQERGMRIFDTTGALRSAARDGERLHYWLDIHWTPRGNEVAAHAMADWLIGGGLTETAQRAGSGSTPGAAR